MNKLLLAIPLAVALPLGACTNSHEDTTLRSAGTGAAIGAVGGAAVGAVVPGVSPITGAIVGAAVGGLAGAIWADRDNDGRADGYYYNGTYYPGEPPAAATTSPVAPAKPPARARHP